ncbi:MAG: hypothetical protein PHF14_10935 [Verrucomicrobiota bacterium]|jgi:hypothetical protein|nr:hypothetical protein [Verrucomicrobiota bacterium]MDD8046968.1 hypothetical protein [Verrucomicrobiota bacterium]MDD8050878.1 hypothetical protein [Verrucomicrobiota bacterium]MDI9383844.1 hypothetical protein [Verrucomicrobiota bacterium]HCF95991.1 hypothetical protein [Verrucomicrobiota bacterium]
MPHPDEVQIPPDLQASLLCDDVRREQNGKFMLIGLFDAIATRTFPVVHPRMFVVNRWCGGVGRFSQRTKIFRPDQVTALAETREFSFLLQHEHANVTNIECFVNLRFEEPGTYWVETLLDGDLKLRYPLRVAEIKNPAKP